MTQHPPGIRIGTADTYPTLLKFGVSVCIGSWCPPPDLQYQPHWQPLADPLRHACGHQVGHRRLDPAQRLPLWTVHFPLQGAGKPLSSNGEGEDQ